MPKRRADKNVSTIIELVSAYNPKYVSDGKHIRMKCPFREKHSATSDGAKSFFITESLNAYHCFSCGSKGTVVSLLVNKFKLKYSEAKNIIVTNIVDMVKGSGKEMSERTVSDFYDGEIIPIEPPKDFIDRGFSEKTLRRLKIGGEGNHIYIPIFDSDIGEKIVAVKHRIGRNFWYEPKNFPKELFLYNYKNAADSQSRERVKKVILVEGETDVINVMEMTPNVVSTSGGELTEKQAELLEHFDEVYLAFDMDKAGTVYTEIAESKLRKKNKKVYIILYDADDPGSCEPKKWLRAYASAVTYSEYRFEMSLRMGDEYIKHLKK